MTRFDAFPGLRYHPTAAASPAATTADVTDLVAPPYDVLSDAHRQALEDRNPANSVRLDYPHGATDPDAYTHARTLLDTWLADATLRRDEAPTLTVYRMKAPSGRSTTGVLGALGLEPPGIGDVLPHEETTAKDKADRLSLIRATQINTSPIWVLATAKGLGQACAEVIDARPSDASADDLDGVRHEVWVVTDAATIQTLRDTIIGAPVVVADGHHRFETALAYEREQPTADAILAYVVELTESELEVRPIHRIVSVPTGTDLLAHLDHWFDRRELTGSMDAAQHDGPVLVTGPATSVVLVPKTDAFDDDTILDSQRLRIALANLDGTEVRFHHDPEVVVASVGPGSFGVLLRPATVAQIRAVAAARTRMPPKTTFFWPKPRTGLVFRPALP